jgi:hypothetical protein
MQGKSVNENILANLLFTLLKVSRKQLRRNTLWDMVAIQLAYQFLVTCPLLTLINGNCKVLTSLWWYLMNHGQQDPTKWV